VFPVEFLGILVGCVHEFAGPLLLDLLHHLEDQLFNDFVGPDDVALLLQTAVGFLEEAHLEVDVDEFIEVDVFVFQPLLLQEA